MRVRAGAGDVESLSKGDGMEGYRRWQGWRWRHTVDTFHCPELYTQKWLRPQILCLCVLPQLKNLKKNVEVVISDTVSGTE